MKQRIFPRKSSTANALINTDIFLFFFLVDKSDIFNFRTTPRGVRNFNVLFDLGSTLKVDVVNVK